MQTIEPTYSFNTCLFKSKQALKYTKTTGYYFRTLLGERVSMRKAMQIVSNNGIVFRLVDPYPVELNEFNRYFAAVPQSEQTRVHNEGLLPTQPLIGCGDGVILAESPSQATDLATAYALNNSCLQQPFHLYEVRLPTAHIRLTPTDTEYGIEAWFLETKFGVPSRFIRSRGYSLTI